MMTWRPLAAIGMVFAFALSMVTCGLMRPATSPLHFSHKLHVVDEEIECTDCHRKMDNASDLKTSHLPKEKICLGCHSKKKKDCAFCHTDPLHPSAVPRRVTEGIRFSHKNHVKRIETAAEKASEEGDKAGEKKGDDEEDDDEDEEDEDEDGPSPCVTCHAPILTATTRSPEPLIPQMMGECMSCHRQDFRTVRCDSCHTNLVESKTMPFDFVSHNGDFLSRHGGIARGDQNVCSHCHTQSSCAECHSRMAPARPSLLKPDAVDNRMHHRGDFMLNHTIEARANPDACLTCHKPDRCASCHADRGISAKGAGGLGPHPAGWMRSGGLDSHGVAARRNILSCAVCHDRGKETNCVSCHRVGGSGGSPHAPGWSSHESPTSGRVCVWCHR